MKRVSLALTIIAIISLMVIVNAMNAKALFGGGDGIYPVLSNCYPTGVGTYTNTTIDISINYYLPKNSTQINSYTYSLDEKSNSTLSYTAKDVADIFSSHSITDPSKYNHYSIYGTLENLTNDQHTLRTFAYFLNGTVKSLWNQTFRVNTNFKEPQLIVLSPQNQSTYNNGVPIVTNTNSKLLWAYYSLDSTSSETWVPFSGNMTLTGLSEGYHTLRISVKTEANAQSTQATSTQTVYFNFVSDKNALLIILIVIMAAVVAGLLFKMKKADNATK